MQEPHPKHLASIGLIFYIPNTYCKSRNKGSEPAGTVLIMVKYLSSMHATAQFKKLFQVSIKAQPASCEGYIDRALWPSPSD